MIGFARRCDRRCQPSVTVGVPNGRRQQHHPRRVPPQGVGGDRTSRIGVVGNNINRAVTRTLRLRGKLSDVVVLKVDRVFA